MGRRRGRKKNEVRKEEREKKERQRQNNFSWDNLSSVFANPQKNQPNT